MKSGTNRIRFLKSSRLPSAVVSVEGPGATTVGLGQAILLVERNDMDQIIEAIRKIQAHSAALRNAA